ncbi:hypothetical protein ES703_88175 [subsurface metagenome]
MGATKTIKIGIEAYNVIQRIADVSGGSLTEVATAMVGGTLKDIQSSLKELSSALAEGDVRVTLPVALPGNVKGVNRQPGNPNDNTEKAESARAVAEAIEHPMPEIDESGDRGEGSGLASPESEDEHETGAGKWIALAFLALLAVGQLQRVANQDYRTSGVM